MATLKELQDGTYSLDDVLDMHEVLDLKYHLTQKSTNRKI